MTVIRIQHPAINNGTEARLEVDMTPIRDLPRTPGGLRRLGDVRISTRSGSLAYRLLSAAMDSPEPLQLRARI